MPPFCCNVNGQFGVGHDSWCRKTPLAPWERELLGQKLRSDVEFFLKDGTSFIIEGIEIDTIGDNGENKGITAVESAQSDNTFHVPNVLYWTIHHKYV